MNSIFLKCNKKNDVIGQLVKEKKNKQFTQKI